MSSTSEPPMSTTTAISTQIQTCDNSWFYQPDPSDCSGYYQCSSGRITQHRCSFGLHWNKMVNTCDWPSSAGCKDPQDLMQSTTNMQTMTTPRPTTTTTAATMWTTRTTTRPTTTTTMWTPQPTQSTTIMYTTQQPPELGAFSP